LEEATRAAGTKLKSSIRAVARCAETFPPFKSALDDMSELIGVLEDIVEDGGDLQKLFSELQTRTDALETYVIKLDSESVNGSVSRIVKSIHDHLRYVKEHRKQGTLRSTDTMSRARDIEILLKQLNDDVSLRTWENTAKQLEQTLLERLSPVHDARYNSSYATTIQRGGCTSGTRQGLQKMLQSWARPVDAELRDSQHRPEDSEAANYNVAKVFWMNGMAGTGKTTITYSLCEWLENNSQLGASFFCSHTSDVCQSIEKTFPTIAYQLGRFSPAYLSELCKALRADPDAATREVRVQLDKLIMRPIQSIRYAIPNGIVVVIDALDECRDNYGAETITDLLLTYAVDLPLKFFTTSRPEPLIRERMLSSSALLSSRSVVHLHDIEASIVEDDITTYLADSLKLVSPSPTTTQLRKLAKQVGKLFIYAATLVRYISPRRARVDSRSRLQKILAMDPRQTRTGSDQPTKIYEELDKLYTKVLELAFHEDLESGDLEIMQNVLRTVVCAKEPLTIETLTGLLGVAEEQVSYSLEPLYSVLHVPEGGGLISTLHASFPDFLLSESRGSSVLLRSGSAQHSVGSKLL
ncbi:hypothetical protein FRC11_010517, partial [Ceratobasidium sp. 423]